MADFEVHIDLNGRTRQVGLARSEAGARPAEINRMASAFEHHDLERSLAL